LRQLLRQLCKRAVQSKLTGVTCNLIQLILLADQCFQMESLVTFRFIASLWTTRCIFCCTFHSNSAYGDKVSTKWQAETRIESKRLVRFIGLWQWFIYSHNSGHSPSSCLLFKTQRFEDYPISVFRWNLLRWAQ
jgi:hypothetical protein